jgi:hypothetical protein
MRLGELKHLIARHFLVNAHGGKSKYLISHSAAFFRQCAWREIQIFNILQRGILSLMRLAVNSNI